MRLSWVVSNLVGSKLFQIKYHQNLTGVPHLKLGSQTDVRKKAEALFVDGDMKVMICVSDVSAMIQLITW